MLDKKIIELLRPLRTKYFMSRTFNYLSYALLCFSVVSLVLMLVSRMVPIAFIWNKIFMIGIIFIIIGMIWSIIKRPSYNDAGIIADSMGLKERVVTSLELSGDNTSLSNIQKQDTIEKLNNDELVKNISLKPPTKIVIIAMALIIVSAMVGFIRTPSYDVALQQQKYKQLIEKEKENIEKVEKEVIKDKELSIEEKKLMEKRLQELKKQLDKPKNLQDLQKEMLKTQKEIDKLKKELKDKEIKDLRDKLADKEFTKELAKKLESQDPKEIASELQKMADTLKSSSKEDLQKIAEDMKALAQELSENPELAKEFKDISDAISQNISQNANNANLSDSMNNLQQALSDALSNAEVSESLSQATDTLNQLSETVSQSLQQGDASESNQGSGGKSGSGNGTQGQGQGQGSGNGTSQGTGGGAGDESSSSGSTASKEGSEKQVKEYEKLFTPKNLGGEGSTTQIHSNMNDTGNKDIIQTKKFGDTAGESVPYDEVLDSYKQGAYQRLDNGEIPESMKEIIKEYFSELD